MAEQAETTSTSTEANVDATDAIAGLLLGEQEPGGEETTGEEQTEAEKDEDGVEELPEESTDDVEESEEEENQEAEEDATWEGVLGIDSDKIVLDEEGDFAGVNVKVDGETSTVNMSDLVIGYQTNKHNTNTSKALAEERKQFDAGKIEAVQDYTRKLDDVGKLSEYMNQNLMKEFRGVNWDQLRVENPAEYAASMTDFQSRQQEIQSIQAAISYEREQQSNEAAESSKVQSDTYLQEQIDKMVVNNPEWSDESKLKVAFDEMSDFTAETYGFTTEEFNSVVDSRLIEMIKDARKYRKGLKMANGKIDKPVPKFQKKGSGKQRKKVSKLDSLTKRANAATGANKRDLQTSAIAELFT